MSFKAAMFALVFIASSASANMMPYHEGTQATGHLIAEHPQLQIRNEDLQIQLYDRHALVDVVYEVKNTGAAITVPAVFPSTAIAEVKDFQVQSRGKSLKWKTTEKPNAFFKYEGYCEEKSCDGSIQDYWYKFQLKFRKNETMQVHIRYVSPYDTHGAEWSTGDTENTSLAFRYLLSPGRKWKGPIREGKVTLYAMGLDFKDTHIQSQLQFKRTAPDTMVATFRNLEPTLKDDIVIDIPRIPEIYTDHGKFNPPYITGSEPYRVVTFKTSTDLEQLKTGATIVLDQLSSSPNRLALYPGSGQSRDLYFANNRIAALDIAINGKAPFTVQIPDEVKPWHIIELPAQEKITRIELRVTAVHPGSRFDHTMIHALSLRESVKEIP